MTRTKYSNIINYKYCKMENILLSINVELKLCVALLLIIVA